MLLNFRIPEIIELNVDRREFCFQQGRRPGLSSNLSTAIGIEGIEDAIRRFQSPIHTDISGTVFIWSEETVHGGNGFTPMAIV
jgi:hypothetical protein